MLFVLSWSSPGAVLLKGIESYDVYLCSSF